LGPAILSLCIIGTFATRNSMGDVYVMCVLGVLMYLGAKLGFSSAAIVLGLILGEIAENGFLLGVRLGEAQGSVPAYFLMRPICIIVILIVLASTGFALYLEYKERKNQKQDQANGDTARRNSLRTANWRKISEWTMRQWNLVLGVGLLLGAVLLYIHTDSFPDEPRLFPQVLLITIIVLGIWQTGQSLFMPSVSAAKMIFKDWPGLKMLLVFIFTGLYILLVQVLGFYSATFVFMSSLPLFLRSRLTSRFFIKCVGISIGFTAIMYIVFNRLLMVPTPEGVLI
jgi:putative tricarboxylic transport membrane protein